MKKLKHLPYFFGYLILSYIMTNPLIKNLKTHVLGGGDSYQNLWNLWWVKYAILNQQTVYFTDYLFYPQGTSLAYHTLSLANTVLGIPLQSFFTLIETYNILLFSTFVLSGIGMYLLADKLIDNKNIAFISGVIFTFSPYHFAHALGHINLATIQWIPFFVLYTIKLFENPNLKNSIITASFLLLVSLSSWYYLIYCGFFGFLYLIYQKMCDFRFNKTHIKYFSLSILFFTVLLVTTAWPVIAESTKSHIYAGNEAKFSADVLSYITPSELHPKLGPIFAPVNDKFTGNINENTTYVGFVSIIFLMWAIYRRKHINVNFWFIFGSTSFILSLGTTLTILGTSIGIPLPYYLIKVLPIISAARIPSRFALLVMLSLSCILAYSLKDFIKQIKRPFFKNIFLVVILLTVLLEFASTPLYMEPVFVPTYYEKLKDTNGTFGILELPSNWVSGEKYMYYQTIHNKKLVIGEISRAPREAKKLIENSDLIKLLIETEKKNMSKKYTLELKKSLKSNNIKYVIVHTYDITKEKNAKINYILHNFTEKTYESDGIVTYQIY